MQKQNEENEKKEEFRGPIFPLDSIYTMPLPPLHTQLENKQDAQLSQSDRAAGCVIIFTKSRRMELGDNILRTL